MKEQNVYRNCKRPSSILRFTEKMAYLWDMAAKRKCYSLLLPGDKIEIHRTVKFIETKVIPDTITLTPYKGQDEWKDRNMTKEESGEEKKFESEDQ
ncbi:hypothetical protein CDAR_107891 [Caerostris darwini]|uniref:Uncharacterized protein n=1 Tax=Caerostris darwini TaxID=1538125 RepID=A0AAV4SCF0_9ARAC|nr:hypothetical protein CDAR_107891 [Caerostris darwini]